MTAPNSQAASELRELAALEVVIEQGRKAWLQVSAALKEIHDKKLYKLQGYTSWVNYLRERWKLSHKHVYDLFEHSKVAAEIMAPDEPGEVPAQRHLAELSGFPPDLRKPIYAEAKRTAPGGKLTSAWIELTGRRLLDARLAALKEAKETSADDEDEEEEDEAPGDEAPEPPPVAPDDQAIQDASRHRVSMSEQRAKWEMQAKRTVTKLKRQAACLGTTAEELLRRYG